MPTYHQLLRNPRKRKTHTNNVKALAGCPQKKGICMKLRIVKPKKPNSAQRKVVKVRLSTRRMISVHTRSGAYFDRIFFRACFWRSGTRSTRGKILFNEG